MSRRRSRAVDILFLNSFILVVSQSRFRPLMRAALNNNTTCLVSSRQHARFASQLLYYHPTWRCTLFILIIQAVYNINLISLIAYTTYAYTFTIHLKH